MSHVSSEHNPLHRSFGSNAKRGWDDLSDDPGFPKGSLAHHPRVLRIFRGNGSDCDEYRMLELLQYLTLHDRLHARDLQAFTESREYGGPWGKCL